LFFSAVSRLLKNKKSKKAKIGRGLYSTACIGKPKRERHKKEPTQRRQQKEFKGSLG
jgi:hypothetical protein